MNDIVDILVAGMLLTILAQPNIGRAGIAIIYAGIMAAHGLFMAELDGISYYVSAAIFDSAIILFLGKYKHEYMLASDLQKLAFISILLNAYGWVIYMLYLPPMTYNAAFIAFYAFSIYVLLRREGKKNVGDNSVGFWWSHIRSADSTSCVQHNKAGKI